MRIIDAGKITDAAAALFAEANRNLPADVEARIRLARREETWPRAREILDQIIENFETARAEQTPICQDTGMACVFLEIGQDVHIEGGSIYDAVNEGIRRAQKEGFLRASVVTDPLERNNSGDNTPALIHAGFAEGSRVKITVAPKGFGSENMSAIKMLKPSDGVEGVLDFVVSTVKNAGANPCPPVIAGVGIGGSFDRAALLAKKALLRPLDTPSADAYYAELEKTLLEKINALGIGPGGFGGKTTCLGVAVETFPTHIAGLPCAVNICCHANRRAEGVL